MWGITIGIGCGFVISHNLGHLSAFGLTIDKIRAIIIRVYGFCNHVGKCGISIG
jgi:hypothetical protein